VGSSGTGATATHGTPQPVRERASPGVTAMTTLASRITCAVLGTGTLRSRGRNGRAQLGDGTFHVSASTPVPGNGRHWCPWRSAGEGLTPARCWRMERCAWGRQHRGTIGDVTTSTTSDATAVTGIQAPWRSETGAQHTCSVLVDGPVRWLGAERGRAIENGPRRVRSRRAGARSGRRRRAITARVGAPSCALSARHARCWGEEWGQVGGGNGPRTRFLDPVPMTGPECVDEQKHGGRQH